MLQAATQSQVELRSKPRPGHRAWPPGPSTTTEAAIFHVTHWKAGSQWVHKILLDCCPERVVRPELDMGQFLHRPVAAGMVYPTVYVTREEFDGVRLPPRWARFVMIRDLRDTLVSGYFSLRHSHPPHQEVQHWRGALEGAAQADGLIRLMTDGWLDMSAAIQRSWVSAGEPLVRYEDLLANDLKILEAVLLRRCGLAVPRERFRAAVEANRFERLTGGRRRGQEDVAAHERKGVAGDWRNYFSKRVTRVFKERYGRLLVDTGYERDLDW
jgi:lipopolysaccharide transport system ATP-binding protein